MKGKLVKVISFFLVFSLLLQVLPMKLSSVIAANETVLDVINGSITITNNTYVQKNSQGVTVTSGTVVNDELVITGFQNSGYNINVYGDNLPTIHFRNITTNGVITGTAGNKLRFVFEGNCTFQTFLGSLPRILQYELVGINGNTIKFAYPLSIPQTMDPKGYCDNRDKTLSIENMNVVGDLDQSNQSGNTWSLKTLLINNSNFNNANISGFNSIMNSKFNVLKINGYNQVLRNVTAFQTELNITSDTTIENCNLLKIPYFSVTGICTILNSNMEFCDSSTQYKPQQQLFIENNCSMYIKGSTIATSGEHYYGFLTRTSTGLFIEDSSLNLNSSSSYYKRFYNNSYSQSFQPLNKEGKLTYLNKLKVPNSINSLVNVSINNKPVVSLKTDYQGYLNLYLPIGEHNVKVTDSMGKIYANSFTGASTDDTNLDDNNKGTMDIFNPLTKISTDYKSQSLKFSFNNIDWSNALTNDLGEFYINLPDDITQIYVKRNDIGEVLYTDIIDGVVGKLTTFSSPDISGLIGQINTLTNQITTMQKKIQEANAEYGTLSNTIIDLNNNIDSLNEKVITLTNKNADLESKIQDSNEEKEILEENINVLNEQMLVLKQTISERENELSTALSQINTIEKTVSDLSNEIAGLRSKITLLSNALSKSEEENKLLKEKVTVLENNINDFQVSINELKNSLDDANNTSLELIEQLVSTSDELSTVNTLLSTIKVELGVSNNDDIIPAIQALKNSIQTNMNSQELSSSNVILEQTTGSGETVDSLQKRLSEVTSENSKLLEENNALKEEIKQLKGE